MNFAMNMIISVPNANCFMIVSCPNCDDLISLAHHNELSLLLGYEEMKRITKDIPEFALHRVLHTSRKRGFYPGW